MPPDDRHARRLILAFVALGLLLRLAFGLFYWVEQPLTHDEQEYLALARGLRSGIGFTYPTDIDTGTAQQFGRAPGYPLFLAALDSGRPVPSRVPARLKIAQSLVGAAIVWIIGALAMTAAGPRAGLFAAGIAAIYPPLVVMPAYALSETLYCLLALATVVAVQHAVDRYSWPLGALAGALAGAAALTRPALLFFIPLVCLWMILRGQVIVAVALVLAAATAIAPWTIRNLRTYDRFVLVASEGGVTFWTGNHPLARGEGDLAANPELKQADLEFRNAHPGVSAEALEPLYYRDAWQWIRSHPDAWALLTLRKAFYTVVPTGPSYALHSVKYRVVSVVPYLVVLPFALAGAWRLRRSSHRPIALGLLALSSILVCLIFFPQERFRLPVIDPALIISAAALAGRQHS
jgi:4-amino-4-deoxy-L-arabinose transferase-like glycosyltransferase